MKTFAQAIQVFLWLLVGGGVAHPAETVPPSEIVLGMSTVLNGPAASLGIDMRTGILAGLERANRAGGINGRKLRLIALDDGYEPGRTVPNMRHLIGAENVLLVIGNVGTPTAIAALPIAQEQKTLFFAPFTGARMLRPTPPNRYVINYRASYAEETAAMIDALVGQAGLKPEEIAFFTQRDGYGDAGFSGGIAALKLHGLKEETAILHVRYERNTLAVENAVADLAFAEHPPRAVIMVGAYAPCAKFIRQCRQADIKAVFLNVSFVGSNALARDLDKTDADVIVTQVVPSPVDQGIPIVREFNADLRAMAPAASPGFGDLEGYIAARVLLTALGRIKGEPTREAIIEALEGLGSFDAGLGEPLKLAPDEHQACHRVWPTILRDGHFVPFAWTEIAGLLGRRAAP